MKKIALVVGHSSDKQGASSPSGLTEFAYNKDLAFMVMLGITPHENVEAKIYYRTHGLRNLVDKLMNTDADLFVSFHCNSFGDPNVKGTEVLVSDLGSTASLATELSKKISTQLGTNNRKMKYVRDGERGSLFLSLPNSILIESFFLSNEGDVQSGITHQESLADIIASALVRFVED